MKLIEKIRANLKSGTISSLKRFKLVRHSRLISIKEKLRNNKRELEMLKEERKTNTKRIAAYFSERVISGEVERVAQDIFLLARDDGELNELLRLVFLHTVQVKEVRLAYEFKRKSADFIVKMFKSKNSTASMDTYALSFYYLEKFSDVLMFEGDTSPRFSYIKRVSESMCRNDKGILQGFKVKRPEAMQSVDKKFSELIGGRRVCVVGPAPTSFNNGDYIDEFDVIVRLNYTGTQDLLGFEKTHGSLTHVSFFNGPITKFLNFRKISNILAQENVRVVFRSESDFLRFGNFCCNSRYINTMPKLFATNKSFHGVQRAILDLLSFEPKSLSLFNVDFFTGLAGGKSNRISSYLTAGSDLGYGHDPLQGLRLIRYLRDAELVSVDALIEEILDWSDQEYLAHLEDLEKNKADFLVNVNNLKSLS